MDNRPIGIFDSGVGGLSAVRALMRRCPNENILYLGDEARMPYGTRDRETLLRYAREDLAFVLRQDVKAVLVACGTVSAAALDDLRRECPVPILGVVEPAAAEAARATRNGKIAILGTGATTRSGAFPRAIRRIRPGAETLGVPCPMFVPLVENGYIRPGDPAATLFAEEYLAPVKAFGADVIILGCTHFPVLKATIGQLVPDTLLIDTSKSAVAALEDLLRGQDLLADNSGEPSQVYCVTGGKEGFEEVAERFLGDRFDHEVEVVSLS